MITPLLEKAILKGMAKVDYVSHALGMFGRIPVGSGKLAVITKITWWPFINPMIEGADPQTPTWANFFKWCEYQLKIDSGKGTHYIPFKNSIKVVNLDNTKAIDLTQNMSDTDFEFMLLQPGEPVVKDVYIPISDFCKLTISRNAAIIGTGSVSGLVDAAANEKNVPEGVADVQVAVEIDLQTLAGSSQLYSPPSEEYTGLNNPAATKKYPYFQGIIPRVPGVSWESEISPDGATIGASLTGPCQPLVTFEVVYINKNVADLLQNS